MFLLNCRVQDVPRPHPVPPTRCVGQLLRHGFVCGDSAAWSWWEAQLHGFQRVCTMQAAMCPSGNSSVPRAAMRPLARHRIDEQRRKSQGRPHAAAQVDQRSEAVLVPVYGIMVPFHILTVKNATSNQVCGCALLPSAALSSRQSAPQTLHSAAHVSPMMPCYSHSCLWRGASRHDCLLCLDRETFSCKGRAADACSN